MKLVAAVIGGRTLSAPLGRACQQFASIAERVEQRVIVLEPALGPAVRAQEVFAIKAVEARGGTRRAVAAFGFACRVPKSVYTISAVADAGA